MRPYIFIPLLVLFLACAAQARILPIGPGGYADLAAAAADAQPGDTLFYLAGRHAGGAHVEQLQGSASAPITIMGDATGESIIEGGTNAFQLSDPAHLRIMHLVFDGQTGNGVNIDDGGSFETPANNILIAHCTWRGINATGNNDQLKLSGVDYFEIRDCSFRDASPGGSMIDMVGCHYGVITGNRFENGGSNAIQAKGGTHDILISRNGFYNGGQRAINIGGSTGLAYFRPQNADYEATSIMVWANVFTGSMAPIAYVGAVGCAVVHNTMYMPEKWAVRILQENTDPRFQQCGENLFRNNLVVLDSRAAAPTFNVGPNTRPQTFALSHNLWYNVDDENWQGPNTPVVDALCIIGSDPLLAMPGMSGGNFTPGSGSPAIGAGFAMPEELPDFLGVPFNSPPSIGAIEGDPVVSSAGVPSRARDMTMEMHPQPARDIVRLRIGGLRSPDARIVVHDLAGRRLEHLDASLRTQDGSAAASLNFSRAIPGWYIVTVTNGTRASSMPVRIVR